MNVIKARSIGKQYGGIRTLRAWMLADPGGYVAAPTLVLGCRPRLLNVADARPELAETGPAAPKPEQVRAPLPRHRRESRIPR
jgi:hypothetical protein